MRKVTLLDPMLYTVSPPHAPYAFPCSMLFLLSGVSGKELGGQTASHAPESIVILIGLAATVQCSPTALRFMLGFLLTGFGTICEIPIEFVFLFGLTPSSEFRAAGENLN